MKYLVFARKISLIATSKHTDEIESIPIKNGLFVIQKSLYGENKKVIDETKIPFEIREINPSEWIKYEEEF